MNIVAQGTARGAIERIVEEVTAGLRHGHFEISINGEIIKDEKRRLIVKAGKSHKFVINKEDIA